MNQSFHFRDKGSGPPVSTCKVGPCRFRGKSSSPGSGIFPENLASGGSPLSGPEIGNDMFHRLTLYGHENKRVYREVENRQTDRMAALVLVAFAVFSYLYSRGISPVWAAVAIVCFRGFFRFLYKIACLLVAAIILFCILSYLVF